MKTTIEIPDELFRKAKAAAAVRRVTLEELMCDALERCLAAVPSTYSDRSGWSSVFGLAEPKSVDAIDQIVAEEFERIDASEWDRSST